MVRKFINVFILSFILLSTALYATPKAEVDRNQVYMGESFQLTINAGKDAGGTVPDVSVLQKDFDILSQGQSSQVLISNGKSFTDTLWLFVLTPKHAGKITIPAISVGNETTSPVDITVEASGANNNQQSVHADNRHVFMSANVVPDSPFVQSQGLYKVTIYYDSNIENPKLSEPQADNVNFIHLGNDRNFQKTLNGKQYQVYEVNFAMFPQQSGNIKINSPIFVGNVLSNSAGKYFSNMWQPFRISANDIDINVKPIPQNANSQWWLPAKSITVDDSWSSSLDKLQAGTPVTRTITIKGEDVLANQLPQVMPTQLDNFQIYQDKADTKTTTDGKHIYATRVEKAAFIPSKAGKLTIPAIDIHWWNTDTNHAEVTTIPAKTVDIAKAPPGSVTPSAPPTALSAPISVNASPTTTSHIQPEKVIVQKTTPFWHNVWFWLANGFILLWVITLIVLWRISKNKPSPHKAAAIIHAEKIEHLRKAKSAVKDAVKNNDVLQFKEALINFANLTWPHHTCLSIGDIIDRFEDETAVDALSDFDQALYNKEQKSVDLNKLWKTIEKAFTLKQDKSDDDMLPKMYK